MKLIVGLVGENGSGKTTIAKRLIEIHGWHFCKEIKFSDVLFETLKLWDIPATRENLQKLPQIMDEGYGPGSLTKVISRRIDSLRGRMVLVDGVRWEYDEALIRSYPNNLLVYVTAEDTLRFERLKGQEGKVGQDKLTWEQFLSESQAPNEVVIPEIGSRADVVINNNFGIDDLENEIQSLIQRTLTALQ